MAPLPPPHASDEYMRELAKPVFDYFHIPDTEDLTEYDNAASGLADPYSSIASAFRGNILSTLQVATIPFKMAETTAMQRRYDAFLAAERIRQLKNVSSGADLIEAHEEAARAKARERMQEFQSTDEFIIYFRNAVVGDLANYAQRDEFRSAAQELLRNTLLMFWGTIEVFFSESARVVFNERPDLAALTLSNDSTRKHFAMKALPIEVLAARSFNVASSLGDILLEERQLDSLVVMRDVANVVFPNAVSLGSSCDLTRCGGFGSADT